MFFRDSRQTLISIMNLDENNLIPTKTFVSVYKQNKNTIKS